MVIRIILFTIEMNVSYSGYCARFSEVEKRIIIDTGLDCTKFDPPCSSSFSSNESFKCKKNNMLICVTPLCINPLSFKSPYWYFWKKKTYNLGHDKNLKHNIHLILDQTCYRNAGEILEGCEVSRERYAIFTSTLNSLIMILKVSIL